MGWLSMPLSSMGGHRSAKAYLDAQFTYERAQEHGSSRGLKVLASACPQNRVYYAAAQVMADGIGGDESIVVKRGRRITLRARDRGGTYRITGLMERP